MKFDEPFTPKEARLVLVGCILAIVAIVVGMEYLRPHLDKWSAQMNSKQQTIQRKQSEPSGIAAEEYKRDRGEQ